ASHAAQRRCIEAALRADVMARGVLEGRAAVAPGTLGLALEQGLTAGDGNRVPLASWQRPWRRQGLEVGRQVVHFGALRFVAMEEAQGAADAVGQGRAAAVPAVRCGVLDAPER